MTLSLSGLVKDETPMRYVGCIANWNDEKGFGFVTPNGGGERAFVHIKSFEKRGRRPVDGDLISYEPSVDERRRLNASAIRYVTVLPKAPNRRGDGFPRKTLGILALLAIGIAVWLERLPPVIAAAYVGMSMITFFAYGLDKSAARSNRSRTPENTLHLLELLGGWPGALFAQGSFRHKTRKLSFQIAFWLCMAITLGVLVWLIHSRQLEHLIRQLSRI